MSFAGAARSYGPPVAALLVATVAVLLVRSALPKPAAAPPRIVVHVATTPERQAKPRVPARVYVTVQHGDSLGAIAARRHTTVAALEKLNPGIVPTALRVGQKIRVK